jgi:hypothetical protein
MTAMGQGTNPLMRESAARKRVLVVREELQLR